MTLLLAAVYFVAARLSLQLGFYRRAVAPVWPPTGIALAALLLLGRRHWPGVVAGAFAASVSIGAPFLVAISTAAGSAIESLLGVHLLEKLGLHRTLDRVRDVVILFVFGAVLPVAVSATVGVASYWAGGFVSTEEVTSAWAIWWTANLMGVVVFTPALLVWASAPTLPRGRGREALLLLVCLIGTSLFVFTDAFFRPPVNRLSFLTTPFLIWAALRFRQQGAAAAVLIVAMIAVLGTLAGRGPFSVGTPAMELTMLDLFLGVQSALALVIAASDQERRAAIQLREDFLSIASHELRTPLTPLKLSFQGLQRTAAQGGGTLPPERLRNSLDSASRQIDRLVTLVENLLDASRLNAGRLTLNPEDVDLSALTRDTAARFAPQFAAAGCTVSIDAPSQVSGWWDRLRLEQVITNLLSNAMKYGAGQPIDVTVSRDAATAVLEVRDRGRGIAPGDQARIFERFERAGESDGRIGGLGLGLFITREIVIAMRGTISVRSKPGEGATFRVELPLDRKAA